MWLDLMAGGDGKQLCGLIWQWEGEGVGEAVMWLEPAGASRGVGTEAGFLPLSPTRTLHAPPAKSS